MTRIATGPEPGAMDRELIASPEIDVADGAYNFHPIAPRRLHEFFERRCDINPQGIALVCGDEQLTYRELDKQANQLAQHLISAGIGPGETVGILLQRSVHTYAALLGVLKSGAAFVPVDVSFPRERVEYMANDAGLSL